ncbi:hypothetical protein ABPG75_007633 [Micractinium tetrahymenae]
MAAFHFSKIFPPAADLSLSPLPPQVLGSDRRAAALRRLRAEEAPQQAGTSLFAADAWRTLGLHRLEPALEALELASPHGGYVSPLALSLGQALAAHCCAQPAPAWQALRELSVDFVLFSARSKVPKPQLPSLAQLAACFPALRRLRWPLLLLGREEWGALPGTPAFQGLTELRLGIRADEWRGHRLPRFSSLTALQVLEISAEGDPACGYEGALPLVPEQGPWLPPSLRQLLLLASLPDAYDERELNLGGAEAGLETLHLVVWESFVQMGQNPAWAGQVQGQPRLPVLPALRCLCLELTSGGYGARQTFSLEWLLRQPALTHLILDGPSGDWESYDSMALFLEGSREQMERLAARLQRLRGHQVDTRWAVFAGGCS